MYTIMQALYGADFGCGIRIRFYSYEIEYRLFPPDYGVNYMAWAEQSGERTAFLLSYFISLTIARDEALTQ
ncbi:MAG: hypothetical protein LUC95_02910 [Lachnospiraceae bacterium]|nr:hypothetical protein [Lachnospiraceae bacterium]